MVFQICGGGLVHAGGLPVRDSGQRAQHLHPAPQGSQAQDRLRRGPLLIGHVRQLAAGVHVLPVHGADAVNQLLY